MKWFLCLLLFGCAADTTATQRRPVTAVCREHPKQPIVKECVDADAASAAR